MKAFSKDSMKRIRKPYKVPAWPNKMPYEVFLGLVIHQGIAGIMQQRNHCNPLIFEFGYRAYEACWNKSLVSIRQLYFAKRKQISNQVRTSSTEALFAGRQNSFQAYGFVCACLCVAYGKKPPKECCGDIFGLVNSILESRITDCLEKPPKFFYIDDFMPITIKTKQTI